VRGSGGCRVCCGWKVSGLKSVDGDFVVSAVAVDVEVFVFALVYAEGAFIWMAKRRFVSVDADEDVSAFLEVGIHVGVLFW